MVSLFYRHHSGDVLMALLESIDIPLGTVMPPFELPDPDGTLHRSDELFGPKGLLVIFTCNHCPYAKAVWPRTIKLAGLAKELGIDTVAINPNIHPSYPEDAPEIMKRRIDEWGIPFPYLVDEAQTIAQAFQAQCTPDVYLLNAQRQLVYHGRVDDNWQDETKVTRHELKDAVINLAAGQPIATEQHPSMGCSIKWRS
jgi:peroxiredoxin